MENFVNFWHTSKPFLVQVRPLVRTLEVRLVPWRSKFQKECWGKRKYSFQKLINKKPTISILSHLEQTKFDRQIKHRNQGRTDNHVLLSTNLIERNLNSKSINRIQHKERKKSINPQNSMPTWDKLASRVWAANVLNSQDTLPVSYSMFLRFSFWKLTTTHLDDDFTECVHLSNSCKNGSVYIFTQEIKNPYCACAYKWCRPRPAGVEG